MPQPSIRLRHSSGAEAVTLSIPVHHMRLQLFELGERIDKFALRNKEAQRFAGQLNLHNVLMRSDKKKFFVASHLLFVSGVRGAPPFFSFYSINLRVLCSVGTFFYWWGGSESAPSVLF